MVNCSVDSQLLQLGRLLDDVVAKKKRFGDVEGGG
jgi:hypothetical protein